MKRFWKKLFKVFLVGFSLFLSVLVISYLIFRYRAAQEMKRVNVLLQQSPVHYEIERLMRLKIPDEKNAATYYEKAHELLKTDPFPFLNGYEPLKEFLNDPEKFRLPQANQAIQTIQQWLSHKSVREAFQQIEKASSLEQCHYNNVNYAFKTADELKLSYLVEIKDIVNALVQPFIIDTLPPSYYVGLQNRNSPNLLDNLVYALKASQCLLQDHWLLNEIIYSETRAFVFSSLQDYFKQSSNFDGISPAEKERYLITLLSMVQADQRSWQDRMFWSLEWEKYILLRSSESLLHTSDSFSCAGGGDIVRDFFSWTDKMRCGIYVLVFLPRDVENVLTLVNDTQRLLRSRFKFFKIMHVLREKEKWLTIQSRNPFMGGQTGEFEDIHRSLEEFIRDQIRSNAVELALAVKLYQFKRQGRLPQTLQELINTGILKSLPRDPIAEENYQYETAGKKFFIRSIGLKKWCADKKNESHGLCYRSIRYHTEPAVVWESY